MSDDLSVLEGVIRGRRTVKRFTGEPIPRPLLERVLDLARWAPTHRLHQPWRFTVLDQAAIRRLMAFLRQDPVIAAFPDPAKAQAKLTKLLARLPTAGVLVQVTWVRDPVEVIDDEDRTAAACAVQNILLGAHAAGLAGYWSTTAALGHPKTLAWCGIDTNREGFLGAVWIGHPHEAPPAPDRLPLEKVVRWH